MDSNPYIGIMHPDSHNHGPGCECQALVNEIGFKWPELPWTCGCGRTFNSHVMTLAVVNEKLVKVARSIVAKGRKRLEKDEKEPRLDPAERAQTKLLMGLAEEVLSHPASFACAPCMLRHQSSVAEASTSNGSAVELLIELLKATPPGPSPSPSPNSSSPLS